MMNANMACSASTKISNEDDCEKIALQLGIEFVSTHGINKAAGGCFWHRSGGKNQPISNIGFNADLEAEGSSWRGIGSICYSTGRFLFSESF